MLKFNGNPMRHPKRNVHSMPFVYIFRHIYLKKLKDMLAFIGSRIIHFRKPLDDFIKIPGEEVRMDDGLSSDTFFIKIQTLQNFIHTSTRSIIKWRM